MNQNIDINSQNIPRHINGVASKYLSNAINRTWEKLLIFLGVVGFLLPNSPFNMPLTYRDSGVFLYFGWRILHGELPYRDIWDHKPPVIFYLNALGLAISNNSRWGIWAIELISLLVAAAIGFRIIDKFLGRLPARFSTLLWLSTLVFVIQGGNLTEEFALPLQFGCLWLIYEYEKSHHSYWHLLLIGLLTSLAFFTKQTTIGIGIAIVVYLIIRRLFQGQTKLLLRELSFIAGGGFVVLIFIVTFFSVQGALQPFWSAAFKFNFAYSCTTLDLMSHLQPITTGLEPLVMVGLFQLSLIGYLIGLSRTIKRKDFNDPHNSLLSVALIGLPIEFILVSASGRTPPHYYMSMLPILTLFSGITFSFLLAQVSHFRLSNNAKTILTLCASGVILWFLSTGYSQKILSYSQINYNSAIEYIRNSSSPDESVLFWGAEASKNYFAQRRSPSRYVYLYPLYQPNFVDEQMIGEFISDIIRNKPKLIIDTKNPKTPLWDFPIQSKANQLSIQYIRSQYRIKENIGSWTVYEYVGDK